MNRNDLATGIALLAGSLLLLRVRPLRPVGIAGMDPDRFEWDRGNRRKNLKKHGVTTVEAESVFEADDQVAWEDRPRAHQRERYFITTGTSYWGGGRRLRIVFVYRHEKIRIVSARPYRRGQA